MCLILKMNLHASGPIEKCKIVLIQVTQKLTEKRFPFEKLSTSGTKSGVARIKNFIQALNSFTLKSSFICKIKSVSSHCGETSSNEPKEKTRSPFKG